MPNKISYACFSCKSEEILLEAYAAWDKETQQWVLVSTYETAFCTLCDSDTRLEQIQLTEETK